MEIRLDGVGHALSDRQLEVPLYQRSYAWTKKQINDLYQDISDAILNGEAEYFLGSIVVIKRENSREEVVDGQQRLATLSILLGAIRNYFAENSEVQRADIIQSQFLLLHDRNTLEVQPRLKLNSTDHDFFPNQILIRRNLPDITAVQRQSNERLFDATHLAEGCAHHLSANITALSRVGGCRLRMLRTMSRT